MRANELIKELVTRCRKARLSDLQTAGAIYTVLTSEGFLADASDEEAGPAKRDPLASTIRWSTDFSKPPTVASWSNFLVLRWCSEFRMECRVYSGTEVLKVFASYAETSRPLQVDDEVYEAIVPKEFAWAEVVGWPPEAHEAIAARLQAEADRFRPAGRGSPRDGRVSRAFYAALSREQQTSFRAAVVRSRDWRPRPAEDQAWLQLGFEGREIDRTHVLDLYDRFEERLALLTPEERAPIAAALLGGAP